MFNTIFDFKGGNNFKSFSRYYSTGERRKRANNILGNILNSLFTNHVNKEYISNEQSQKAIETLLFDQYELLFKNYKGYSVSGINTDLISPRLKSFLIEKNDDLVTRIKDFKEFCLSPDKKKTQHSDVSFIINELDLNFILNLCLLHFIIISTYQDSEDKDKFYSINVAITIGKKMLNKYLYTIKCRDKDFKDASYSEWYAKKISSNELLLNKIENDQIIAQLGFSVIQILESCNMVTSVLIIKSKEERYYTLTVDKKLLDIREKSLIDFPLRLPMLVEPKPYDKGVLGGYLLNDVNYKQELIIHKSIFKDKSVVKDDNVIYNMVNNIGSTPYKINTELLDYILTDKHGLLLDPNKPSIYENIEKKSKQQQSKYSSEISKLNLQETILGIADFYKNFPAFYFPIRMDIRGRIYCSSTYLNYQSSELAKALLLFSNPGIVNKKDLNSVKYLEFYGINCFGKDKISDRAKSKWVQDNLQDIINYDNGILLNKAKEKLLFLAFCIEYKRYVEFLNNENAYEFHTYLPVQLDATCNGFQHLALLSNEDTLFKELNLIVDENENNTPNDFYSFLIHKLGILFDTKIAEGITENNGGSYVRLKAFYLDRQCIKKAIMTIPYNASMRSMRSYIIGNLHLIEKDGNDSLSWYSKSEKHTKPLINNKDVSLLVGSIQHIVHHDFLKIKKLMKYLRNIATVLTIIGLPIIWSLPHGLVVVQSYLETKSTSIRPFEHSKAKINIQVVNRNVLDKGKQIRALMPNLIHSLDASTLSLLYNKFSKIYDKPQFLAIHDCFGTTLDKVSNLKTLLASVYMDLYSNDPYLDEFDKNILNLIEKSGKTIDKEKRTVEITINGDVKQYELHSIEWVKNKEKVNNHILKRIDAQHILI